MTARAATADDLDWMVARLSVRRQRLEPRAPVFWRAADDADGIRREFIDHLLADGGARGWRTEHAFVLATPAEDGWLVDDADADDWSGGEARAVWDAFADEAAGDRVRFVCPTYEGDRTAFARAAGLAVDESWWLLELADSGGGQPGQRLTMPGAKAVTVGAPPVYAPPGPILFLPGPTSVDHALPVAPEIAAQRGCAAVVVNQKAGDGGNEQVLEAAGFRRHCDFFGGVLRSV